MRKNELRKEKRSVFFLPSLCVSLSQSHAEPFCLTARLCSLSVISVDQSAQGGRGKKRWRAASQSRSSTSNPTGWNYAVGIQCQMLSSPNSSFLALRPANVLSHDRPLSVCFWPQDSHVLMFICRKFPTLIRLSRRGVTWIGVNIKTWPQITKPIESFASWHRDTQHFKCGNTIWLQPATFFYLYFCCLHKLTFLFVINAVK